MEKHPHPASAEVPQELLQKTRLANSLAEISDGNAFLIKQILDDPQVTTLRDVAVRYDPGVLKSIVRDAKSEAASRTPLASPKDASPRAASISDATPKESGTEATSAEGVSLEDTIPKPIDVQIIQRRPFQAEPSAVVQRMVSDDQVREVIFLESEPDFNIRGVSVTNAIQEPGALKGIAADDHPQVVETLKTLQRVQSLTADPESVPALVNSGIKSAHQVAQMPNSQFLRRFENDLGHDTAGEIHAHATITVSRNEQALLQLYQAVKGAGVAAIDGVDSLETRMTLFNMIVARNKVNINLEALFGGLDYCECDDCTTVYSPANYYVDLLQYLRNNNLDPRKKADGTLVHPVSTTLDGTVLEVLLKRRPDLQHLLLTCENTNTLIPYIDLANEVMESFVVHLDKYPKTWTIDAQSEIDVFNVLDETSDELLAEPQHTNYKAYCILRQAVYPLSALPFHQPIEAIRIYLRYLKTSRTELLDIFWKTFSPPTAIPPFDAVSVAKLASLHDTVIDRAVTAEFLNIIHEEYILLTKEAFWPREYFDITRRPSQPLSITDFQQHIGVRKPRESWVNDTDASLRSDDKIAKIGICFVKAQFMKRAGMDYVDFVNLVKTRFVNLFYPKAKTSSSCKAFGSVIGSCNSSRALSTIAQGTRRKNSPHSSPLF